jgi:hypothetical protein
MKEVFNTATIRIQNRIKCPPRSAAPCIRNRVTAGHLPNPASEQQVLGATDRDIADKACAARETQKNLFINGGDNVDEQAPIGRARRKGRPFNLLSAL